MSQINVPSHLTFLKKSRCSPFSNIVAFPQRRFGNCFLYVPVMALQIPPSGGRVSTSVMGQWSLDPETRSGNWMRDQISIVTTDIILAHKITNLMLLLLQSLSTILVIPHLFHPSDNTGIS